ncbi:MAG: hypothetical protein LUO84_04565 [Methanomassiliicoccales archaeon]|nr:hypothetical protein [Methanomassiliicoccales archaeon]
MRPVAHEGVQCMERDVTVRGYEPGDEASILLLLERAFRWPAFDIEVPKIDHWRWKYLDNPLGFQLIGLVEDENGIICHSGGLPLMIMVGSELFRGLEGSDICRDPDRASESMLIDAIRSKNEQAGKKGIEFAFSFPAEGMYGHLVGEFGYRDTGLRMLRHIFVLQPERFFKEVRMGPFKRIVYWLSTMGKGRAHQSAARDSNGYDLEDLDRFDSEFDELTLIAAKSFGIIPLRSQERMNWRYADKRAGDFYIRTARHAGRMVGYVILKASGSKGSRYCVVADLLIDPEFPTAVDVLLLESLRYARTMDAISLSCNLLDNHPYIKPLRRMGFVMLRDPPDADWTRLTVSNRQGNAHIENTLNAKNLKVHIMVGDTDGI